MPIFYYMAPNVYFKPFSTKKRPFLINLTFKIGLYMIRIDTPKVALGERISSRDRQEEVRFVVAAEEIPDSDKYNITVQKSPNCVGL